MPFFTSYAISPALFCFVLIFFITYLRISHNFDHIQPSPPTPRSTLTTPFLPTQFHALFLSLPPPLFLSSFPPSLPTIVSLFMPPLSRTVCIGQLLLDLGPTVKYTNDPPSRKTDSSFPKCYQMPIFPQLRVGLLAHFFFFFYGLVFVFETGSHAGLEYTVYSTVRG